MKFNSDIPHNSIPTSMPIASSSLSRLVEAFSSYLKNFVGTPSPEPFWNNMKDDIESGMKEEDDDCDAAATK